MLAMLCVRIWRLLSLLTLISLTACDSDDSNVITLTCRSKGVEIELCKELTRKWSEENGVRVEIISLPNASGDCFSLYQQWLQIGSKDVDIYQIDSVWSAAFADHFVDLTDYVETDFLENFFTPITETIRHNNQIIALPLYTDIGVVYYRKDLLDKYHLPRPASLEELYESAYTIQEAERAQNPHMHGLVFHARAQESLTCFALELFSAFRGKIINENYAVTISQPACVSAMRFIQKSIGTISPKSVLNYSEEEARGMFQSGNAVFMRNWPYAWALMNSENSQLCGKVDVMSFPPSRDNGKTTGALGGWHLSVSKYSRNREKAISLAKYLTSRESQRIRAIRASYAPAYIDLYNDIEIRVQNPFFRTLALALRNAAIRPAKYVTNYNIASAAIYTSVHDIMSKKKAPDQALADCANQLTTLMLKAPGEATSDATDAADHISRNINDQDA